MKHTFYGKTGRAQVTVVDLTDPNLPTRKRRDEPEFQVRLLPRSANRSTAYTSAGDLTYSGSDLSKALMHVRAWTGLDSIELPAGLQKYLIELERAS
jgi:hypothetical protein